MIWKAKHTKIEPKDGETRLKRIFAWLPVYISGEIIWLSTYEYLQVYRISTEIVIIEEKQTIFAVGIWKNLSKRICR